MKNKILVFILAVFILGSVNSSAQDRRTVSTKVADILAQMPTMDNQHRDRLMNEIIEMQEAGIMAFCAEIVSPGTGDDTKARFALESLSKFVTQDGKNDERNICANSYVKAIDKTNSWEIKEFFIRQLQFCGYDESIAVLKKFLMHKMLGFPSARALINIGSKQAEKALIQSLKENMKVDSKELIPVIKALGYLKSTTAVPYLHDMLDSENKDIKNVTLYALALIADPSSGKIMAGHAKKAGYKNDPTAATSHYLTYASMLGNKGESTASIKICKYLIKKCKKSDQVHTKTAALELLSTLVGIEAMPYLLKEFKSKDKKLRGAVLRYANDIKSSEATDMWLKVLPDLEPDVKVELINMLGERGDKNAIGPIKNYLNSKFLEVRLTSVSAIAKLAGEKAIPVLIQQLIAFPDDDNKVVLLTITDSKNISEFVSVIDGMPIQSKALIIDVIADRRATGYFPIVYAYCQDKNEKLASSAIRALKNISSPDNVKSLMVLMMKLDDISAISEVQAAVIEAVNQINDQEKRLLSIEKNPVPKDKYNLVIEMLPDIGGRIALEKIVANFEKADTKTRETAFKALSEWKDFSASVPLMKIVESGNKKYLKPAFKGFVKQTASANISDDQKLLLFRKIMHYAADTDDKKLIINSVAKLKTFLSFVYVSKYIENPDLSQVSARAAMKIALPSDGQENGLSGKIVYNTLQKVIDLLEGPESEYDVENISVYISTLPEEDGFVSIFNGEDLTGWQGLVENPISRARMSKTDLAEKQKLADDMMKNNWSVKDGAIWFNGKGNNLCTIKEYGDFELIVDWCITKKGDSGIYLRGTPQIQIWDTSRVEVGAQVGSGGLYNNAKNERNPLIVADNPVGDWNTFRITMIAERVSVYLNGILVVDNVIMENYWDRTIPIFTKGFIELQAHGSDLGFRDIYLREIVIPEYNLPKEEIDEGFVALFNGKDLKGWIGNKVDYSVENGDIVINPKRGGHGNLYTEEEYGDFHFRFEFQLTPGANNGLGIRTPLEGDAAYTGMELQILDNTAEIYANLEKYQFHGSVYGVIPAKRGFLKPVGEWNYEEVIIKGSKIKIILNENVIVNGDIMEASKNGTLDKRDHPGLLREKGHIGFLGHGSILRFRNIRIKKL